MKIFLSASVPLPNRDPRFIETADVIAIREAVKALVLVALERNAHITFGGHPAITPLIRKLMADAGRTVREHFTLYLSRYFEKLFAAEVTAFEDLVLVEAVGSDRDKSLALMRERMIGSNQYQCGVFIGGMDGVITEAALFRQKHPKAVFLPVASTGAAAAELYDDNLPTTLRNEFTYPSLFRQLLPP